MASHNHRQEITALYNQGLTQAEIGERLGLAQTTVSKYMREAGIVARRKGPRNQAKDRNPFWRGGRPLTRFGYRLAHDPSHPRAHSHGYVLEHIKVAEQMLCRSLRPGEVVHHKNGVRTDNRPENLQVMTRAEHSRHHVTEYWEKVCRGSAQNA